MSRLPQPGSDNGTWGNILNDYLSQAHNADGTIKDGVVLESALSSSAQTKLNAVAGTPDWSVITNKPAVVTNLTTELAAKADDGSIVHLAGNETIAGQKTFGVRTYTKEVYVEPTGGAGNTASVTLDNDNGQIYGVTNNSGGTFGVFDATHSTLPLAIQSDAPNAALVIDGGGVKVKDTSFIIQDDGDNSKQAKFQAASISTGTTRTYTLPNKSDTLATLSDIVATGGIVKPEDYGAVGNGSTDDTTALQNALNAASGKTVYLDPTKTYLHSAVLTISVNAATVTGGGTLLANTEATSAVHVSGNYCSMQGITLAFSQSGATRQFASQGHKLWVSGAHFIATDIYVNGSAGAGVLMDGAAYFTLSGLYVTSTLADGIHCTNGSHEGKIIACTTKNTGDDGFAVVSYDGDASPCSNIVNIGSRSINSAARGFSIVGGQGIYYVGGRVDTSAAASIYVACEPSYVTRTTTDAVVEGFEIVGANTAAASNNQGAIVIYNGRSSSYVMDRITIRNVTIRDTNSSASQQVSLLMDTADTDNMRDIVFDSIRIQGAGPTYKVAINNITKNRYRLCTALIERRWYVTSAYTADNGSDQVLLIGPGGSVVLPDATRCVNSYTVRNTDSAAHNVTAVSDSGATQQINSTATPYSIAAGQTTIFLPDASGQWFSF